MALKVEAPFLWNLVFIVDQSKMSEVTAKNPKLTSKGGPGRESEEMWRHFASFGWWVPVRARIANNVANIEKVPACVNCQK